MLDVHSVCHCINVGLVNTRIVLVNSRDTNPAESEVDLQFMYR